MRIHKSTLLAGLGAVLLLLVPASGSAQVVTAGQDVEMPDDPSVSPSGPLGNPTADEPGVDGNGESLEPSVQPTNQMDRDEADRVARDHCQGLSLALADQCIQDTRERLTSGQLNPPGVQIPGGPGSGGQAAGAGDGSGGFLGFLQTIIGMIGQLGS